jgi:hypothetical protein
VNESVKRSKHSWVCLKAYRLYLLGDEEALGNLNIPETEITKMKEFHEELEGGRNAYIVGRAMRFPEFVSRSMGLMFSDYRDGKIIRDLYPSSANRPHVAKAYEQVLKEGAGERTLLANGFTDYEIEKVKLFRLYESCDALPATLSQRTGLAISTVKKLQKIYRENAGTEVRVEMKAGVLV